MMEVHPELDMGSETSSLHVATSKWDKKIK